MQTASLTDRIHLLKSAAPASDENCDLISMNRQIMDRQTLHICIGKALMKTPLFQSEGLTVYCGVPVRYLLPEDAPVWNEFVDFVLCQGEEAVMALKLTDMDLQVLGQLQQGFQERFPPGFTQLFQSSNFHGGWDWFANDVVVPTIAPALQANRMKNQLLPVSAKLLRKLTDPCRRVLVKGFNLYDNSQQWVPTEYGGSLGLLPGFRADKNGRVRQLICCARDNIDGLREVITWGEPDSPPPVKEPGTLSRRIDMAKRGVTAHIDGMTDMVRQLAEMPLQDYFRNDPEGLKEIQKVSPMSHTYQEAASDLASLFGITGAPQDYAYLLEILAAPLTDRTDIPMADKPVRSVLLGASLLAKSRYLTWSGEILLHDHDRSGGLENKPYREWIRKTLYCIRNKDQSSLGGFYNVLYLLTVQPFSLICQQFYAEEDYT